MTRSMHCLLSGVLLTGLSGCTGVVGPGAGSGNGNPTGTGTGNATGTGTGNATGTGTGNATGTGTGNTTGTGNATGTGSGASTVVGTGGAGVPVVGTGGAGTTVVGPGGAGTNPAVCVQGIPKTSQLPRLTRVQYDNTVRDLLQLTSTTTSLQPSTMLAPDTLGSVDQRAWDGYQAAADALSTQLLADTAARAKVIPCAATGDGAACARQFIDQFGPRAFRRPLTADETTRFVAMYTNRATLTATGTFDEGVKLLLRTFLLSPSFLTKAEISATADGANFVLNSYEVASRLSYMLWGSMPDAALFTAAAGNKLGTPEGILTEAQRMLKDPKARTKVTEFHQHYAHMGEGTRWASIMRDPVLYPAFTQAMVPLLTEETNRFFDYVVFDRAGTFKDLLTSPVGFVNATLAPLYGLNAAQYGANLVQVDLDPATRAGIFTRAGFLASYSLFNRPSPILRGAFIQKEVLCTTIAPPPPGVEGTPLPTTGATNRERVTAQTAAAACMDCHHSVINPTGFALEAYDAVGAYQPTEAGMPTNTTANVQIGATAVPVTGAVDLMTKIAASPEAQGCYAQKWVQFAYERPLNSQDTCTAQSLAAKLNQDGYTVVSLITDLTQSQSFRYRAKELP